MIFFLYKSNFRIKNSKKFKKWIKKVLEFHGKKNYEINYNFCNDKEILFINQKYLNHSTYTDIITFDRCFEANKLSADIYISVERVKENALIYHDFFQKELKRVMIHGILHLLGYKDKSAKEKKEMREKEDFYMKFF